MKLKFKLNSLINPELDKDQLINTLFKFSEKAVKLYLIILAFKEEYERPSVTIEEISKLTCYEYYYIRKQFETFRKAGLLRKHTVKKPFKYIILDSFDQYKDIAEKRLMDIENGRS